MNHLKLGIWLEGIWFPQALIFYLWLCLLTLVSHLRSDAKNIHIESSRCGVLCNLLPNVYKQQVHVWLKKQNWLAITRTCLPKLHFCCCWVLNRMGHSSQGHLRSVLKVIKFFSNFYRQYVSMKGINTENFSPIPFLLQFLETF